MMSTPTQDTHVSQFDDELESMVSCDEHERLERLQIEGENAVEEQDTVPRASGELHSKTSGRSAGNNGSYSDKEATMPQEGDFQDALESVAQHQPKRKRNAHRNFPALVDPDYDLGASRRDPEARRRQMRVHFWRVRHAQRECRSTGKPIDLCYDILRAQRSGMTFSFENGSVEFARGEQLYMGEFSSNLGGYWEGKPVLKRSLWTYACGESSDLEGKVVPVLTDTPFTDYAANQSIKITHLSHMSPQMTARSSISPHSSCVNTPPPGFPYVNYSGNHAYNGGNNYGNSYLFSGNNAHQLSGNGYGNLGNYNHIPHSAVNEMNRFPLQQYNEMSPPSKGKGKGKKGKGKSSYDPIVARGGFDGAKGFDYMSPPRTWAPSHFGYASPYITSPEREQQYVYGSGAYPQQYA